MKPKHEEIAARAFEIWEREGRPENRADEHWHRAERELCGDVPTAAVSSTAGAVTTSEDPARGADERWGGRKARGSPRATGARRGGRADPKGSS